MRPYLLTTLILGILASSAHISVAQTPVPQIDYAALSAHPFEIHGLKIAVQKFNAQTFQMKLTNTTASFIAFAPEDVALVDKTGNQLFLNGTWSSYQRQVVTPLKVRIAPGATVSLDGVLNTLATFPVQMFFFDTLCAIVTAE
jgi:hypothetical protein